MTCNSRLLRGVRSFVALAIPLLSACETPRVEGGKDTAVDAGGRLDAAADASDARTDADTDPADARGDAMIDSDAGRGSDAGGEDASGDGGTSRSGPPLFLMAGQSNMEGNPDTTLLNNLLGELNDGTSAGLDARLAGHLRHWYLDANDGYASYGYTEAMAAFEVSELVRLHNAGIVTQGLTTEHPSVLCSLNDAELAKLALNCGHPFGPELVLGQVLGATQPFASTSLIKVAKGGTTLAKDWLSPSSGGAVGPLYLDLLSHIRQIRSDPTRVHPLCGSVPCQWSAFVWFQGENDCFESANAGAYAQNLKNLIKDVRAEIGSPDLPVIVVQVGKWAQSLSYGKSVAAAQESVVASDSHARIVKTDDLSGYYHYDPIAQMIIGERVARAALSMLRPD